jgi:hypothetical protein
MRRATAKNPLNAVRSRKKPADRSAGFFNPFTRAIRNQLVVVFMALATLLNVFDALVPIAWIAVKQTMTISASMTAYSTAVGPSSDFRNRSTFETNLTMTRTSLQDSEETEYEATRTFASGTLCTAGPRLDCENLGREIRDTEARVENLREGNRPGPSAGFDPFGSQVSGVARDVRAKKRPAVAGDESKKPASFRASSVAGDDRHRKARSWGDSVKRRAPSLPDKP